MHHDVPCAEQPPARRRARRARARVQRTTASAARARSSASDRASPLNSAPPAISTCTPGKLLHGVEEHGLPFPRMQPAEASDDYASAAIPSSARTTRRYRRASSSNGAGSTAVVDHGDERWVAPRRRRRRRRWRASWRRRAPRPSWPRRSRRGCCSRRSAPCPRMSRRCQTTGLARQASPRSRRRGRTWGSWRRADRMGAPPARDGARRPNQGDERADAGKGARLLHRAAARPPPPMRSTRTPRARPLRRRGRPPAARSPPRSRCASAMSSSECCAPPIIPGAIDEQHGEVDARHRCAHSRARLLVDPPHLRGHDRPIEPARVRTTAQAGGARQRDPRRAARVSTSATSAARGDALTSCGASGDHDVGQPAHRRDDARRAGGERLYVTQPEPLERGGGRRSDRRRGTPAGSSRLGDEAEQAHVVREPELDDARLELGLRAGRGRR